MKECMNLSRRSDRRGALLTILVTMPFESGDSTCAQRHRASGFNSVQVVNSSADRPCGRHPPASPNVLDCESKPQQNGEVTTFAYSFQSAIAGAAQSDDTRAITRQEQIFDPGSNPVTSDSKTTHSTTEPPAYTSVERDRIRSTSVAVRPRDDLSSGGAATRRRHQRLQLDIHEYLRFVIPYNIGGCGAPRHGQRARARVRVVVTLGRRWARSRTPARAVSCGGGSGGGGDGGAWPWARRGGARGRAARAGGRSVLAAGLALALAVSCAAVPAPAPAPAEPRAQRSANLSHITGTSREIQMFLKNRYLQLLPDGTVNGTTDGNSAYNSKIARKLLTETESSAYCSSCIVDRSGRQSSYIQYWSPNYSRNHKLTSDS
ncbi:hypothetical protein EVAR_3846_1 [Eumeta japonica]|uniref:Uncharacterized protein n=1 Tax=Eumeta variegata TaxID=151549 RepID=A0A4C1ST00_EUMVA|nr:hypothetical protein EVAR_3846_1 [Eumeta japonica]